MTRRVAIIANPIAGGGRGGRVAPELARHLEARGFEVELTLTGKAGDARTRAAELDPDRHWAVVSIGGDGTLNEILNGLPDPTLRLAVMPLGTANVLASELGLPQDPAACAAVVDHGREVRAALGLAGDRRFLLFAGVGIDAHMVTRLEQVRRGTLGKHGWLAPVLHVVWHWPDDRLRVTTEEGETREGLTEVLVTRVRNYGGVFRLPEGIDIEDGWLHVLCFPQTTRMQYLGLAWRAWRRGLRAGDGVEILRTRALTVSSARTVPVQVDGDFGGHTPLDIRLAPEAARILAPQ